MADIFQCPRCGAITYRYGITIHDDYHSKQDVEITTLTEKVGATEGFELRNWPQPDVPESAPEPGF